MLMLITRKQKSSFLLKIGGLVLVLFFLWISSPLAANPAQPGMNSKTIPSLPTPGAMVRPSTVYSPILLKGMTIHIDDPLKFDFIIDAGDSTSGREIPDIRAIKSESSTLIKYFLTGITVPNDNLWVNLSPYEQDRIIPEELGKTQLGMDMLAQDYILKQLSASLMYPESELGDKFWSKVYKKAKEVYGVTEIPINAFNKVWVLPNTATVYEHGQTVYITNATLKVMLDSDFQAMQQAQNSSLRSLPINEPSGVENSVLDNNLQLSIMKEIIIPEIEREVNEGRHFAPLRQIYHSLILAKWYKEMVKNNPLKKVYVDQNKIAGVESEDADIKNKIYVQYLEAYKIGVFNYIRDDYDLLSEQAVPRKYFSGGGKLTDIPMESASILKINPIHPQFRLFGRIMPEKKEAGSSPVATPENDPVFQSIYGWIKTINPDVDVRVLQDKYLASITGFNPFERLLKSDKASIDFKLRYHVNKITDGDDETSFRQRFGRDRSETIHDHAFLRFLSGRLHIPSAYLVENVNIRPDYGGLNHYLATYEFSIFVPKAYAVFMQFYLLVGDADMYHLLFGESLTEQQIRNTIRGEVAGPEITIPQMHLIKNSLDQNEVRILGVNYPSSSMGNKERSFVTFEALALPYPKGLSISEGLVKAFMKGSPSERKVYLDYFLEILKRENIHVDAATVVAVRSNPKQSMPGILTSKQVLIGDLENAILRVAGEWNSPKAEIFRRRRAIPDDFDLPLIIQEWISGVSDDAQYDEKRARGEKIPLFAAGVFSTRDPNTNKNVLYGKYIENANGLELMSGLQTGTDIKALAHTAPDLWEELTDARRRIEEAAGFPQEVEFVIRGGRLYFLQMRALHFAPQGEIAYLREQLDNGKMDEAMAIPRIESLMDRTQSRAMYKVREAAQIDTVSRGTDTTTGAMQGFAVFSEQAAMTYVQEGKPVIPVVSLDNRNAFMDILFDFPEVGLITNFGNGLSHEVDLTRKAGIPAIINVGGEVDLENNQLVFPNAVINEGDFIGIDADNNRVFMSDRRVIELDRFIFDASRGNNIKAIRAQVEGNFLMSDGNFRPDVTYEELLHQFSTKISDSNTAEHNGDHPLGFRYNVEKHIIHDLLGKKGKELNKDLPEVEWDIRDYLSNPDMDYRSSSPVEDPDYGGIDLNDIHVEHYGSEAGIIFQSSMENIIHMNVDGFSPVIIDVIPLPDVMSLFGFETAPNIQYKFSQSL